MILLWCLVLCFIEGGGLLVGGGGGVSGCEGNFLSAFQGSQIGQKLNQFPVSVWSVAMHM